MRGGAGRRSDSADAGRGGRPGAAEGAAPPPGAIPAYLLAAAGLAADAGSSLWAWSALRGRGRVWLWRPWLALRLVLNPGATLGILAGHSRALTLVAAGAVALLAYLVARWPRGRWGLALMLAGAGGNLASRLATGGVVVDFLQVRFWPGIFNPADILLRAGAVWTLVALAAGRARR